MDLSMDKMIQEYALYPYWKCVSGEMVRLRNWHYEKREENGEMFCQTEKDYDNFAKYLGEKLPNKPIGELTIRDLLLALEKMKNDKQYSLSTMKKVLSFLNDLFEYAQDHGHACNIVEYYRTAKKGERLLFDLSAGRKKLEAQALELIESGRQQVRSLTLQQQIELVRLCARDIEADGRSCGIMIAIYAGLRPAEVRGLVWGDLSTFIDDAGKWYLKIHNYLKPDGTRNYGTKTRNGYRKIPIHPELAIFLTKRQEYVEKCYAGDIKDLPICCKANDFNRACRDFELSVYAERILNQVNVKKTAMLSYLAEQVITDSIDEHLSLYVLRRNFWTWLEGGTRLTDLEKRYVMGHDMKVGEIDYRDEYNDESKLLFILEKMERHIIDPELRSNLVHDITPGRPLLLKNCGVCKLRIGKEQIARGGKLCICMDSGENHGMMSVEILGDADCINLEKGHLRIMPLPPIHESETMPINTEADDWAAVNKAARRLKRVDLAEDFEM